MTELQCYKVGKIHKAYSEVIEGLLPCDASDADAVLVSSQDRLDHDVHYPALDIDFPARLVSSSTPGHFHLYLSKAMSWKKYKQLLKALSDAGIIEEGYCKASLARGFTALRLPHVKKGQEKTPLPRGNYVEVPK